jgi:hypothetical protein
MASKCDAVVDPARRVALEQEVGQRRHEHAGRVGRLPHEPDVLFDVGLRDAPDEEVGDLRGVGLLEPLGRALGARDADLTLVEDVLAHPRSRLRLRECLGQQCLRLEDLDAAIAHHLLEGVVLRLRLRHPEHIVEEQVLGVRRGEPRVLESRPVDHDLSQLPDLRVHSERHL